MVDLAAEELTLITPQWAEPLFAPAMYKGAKGGRSGGKSHLFAEMLVENIVINPDYQFVCIREIQKSLKYSAKKLVESKIRAMGYISLFKITDTEIRRIGGQGLIIFQGMQDHTADSIKSLEGFDGAWFEEAQNASARSLELLIPTIRKEGSEIWFSWNPDQRNDAVENHFRGTESDPDFVLVTVNYLDNPWRPAKSIKQADAQKLKDYERFVHIWLGGYNTKSAAQIFAGYWESGEFEPADDWEGPYQGLDFGFANDPTCGVRAWIHKNKLYVEYDSHDDDEQDIGLELDDTADWLDDKIPGVAAYALKADNARPESISYLRRHGLPKIEACTKWPGSVEDGLEYLKTFDAIVIHVRCRSMLEEARLYCYKVDKRSGEILPAIQDDHNHRWDALRYALGPMIKQQRQAGVFVKKKHRN
ncbi:MAG: PBSX family phage terminase large subunit [Blastopirellula sp.]|nr:MAG: PBSX family phage terminase large subunit [Blastopirellula sp.]